MTPRASLLICATPRSGSTLMCGLLKSTGVAGIPESYFREPDEALWADKWHLSRTPHGTVDDDRFLAAAVAAGSTDNGVFSARVMWGSMDRVVGRLTKVHPGRAGGDLALLTATFGSPQFVHLRREDTVAQAVSWSRAEQTDHWHPREGGSNGRRPEFDRAQIEELVGTISEHDAAWREWFLDAGVEPLTVTYEALVRDMAATTLEVLDLLDVSLPPDRSVRPADGRQADHVNRDWIERYSSR